MDKHELTELLNHVADGSISPDDAALKLKIQPFQEIGEYAKVDFHRGIRQGVPEVIYGAGKAKEHILGIAKAMVNNGQKTILITRLSEEAAEFVKRELPLNYNSIQHMLKNRRYIGEYQYRDVLIPDGIPAIVPKELFDRVQEKIEKNKKAPARHKAEDDYLLTTKLFCGYCGAYLCGESGKSRNGTIHHYYKCVSVKKKRTDCKKKPVRKQWLEDLVVNEVMKVVMDDQAIEAIVSMVMDLQDRENTNLPLYEQQLQEAQRGIDNLLNAIQQGILTKSTKTRLEELEATKEDLEIKIANEKIAKPRISPEFVTFWLHKFRKLDVRQQSHRKMLIDAFVNAIYLYDDKMVITFNYKDGTRTIALDDVKKAVKKNTGSDLDCFAAPYRVFLQHLKGC